MTLLRNVSWKRIGRMFLTIFLVVILIGAAALGVVYQLDPWWSAVRMRKLMPGIDVIPTPIHDSNIAALPGQRVEGFGASFQLPWAYPEKVDLRHKILLASGNGGTIAFEDPSSDPWTAHMIREFAKSIPTLGPDTRGSICSLQRVAMDATTEQVKWWKIPSQNERAHDLLLLKLFTEPMSDGNLYAVNVKGLCGFQRGDPRIAPYGAQIELFDSADRHYKMRIISYSKTPVFTQAELNAIIASTSPVPSPAAQK